MKKDFKDKNSAYDRLTLIKAFIIELAVAAGCIFLFAVVMYFAETGFRYAPVFATGSAAAGSLAGAFFAARKTERRGWLTGLIIGTATFLILTLVSLIINHGGLTQNTLFRFIIVMLASLIGGVIGVNKGNNHKYI